MHMPSTAQPPTPLPDAIFALPGILPEDRQLVLSPETQTALLLSVFPVPPWFRTFSLTPSATRVFLALLQAYPQPCSYARLFAALFPAFPEPDQREQAREYELIVSPVRRALKALLPTLRGCGLRAVSLRTQGYVLAAAPTPPTISHQSGDDAAGAGWEAKEDEADASADR